MSGIRSGKFYDPNDLKKNNRTTVTSAFERNGSRIKRFRNPERIDIDKAVPKWFKEEISVNVAPVSGPLFLITLVVPEFKVNTFLGVNLYGNLQLRKSNLYYF